MRVVNVQSYVPPQHQQHVGEVILPSMAELKSSIYRDIFCRRRQYMTKYTSEALGDHFTGFIEGRLRDVAADR